MTLPSLVSAKCSVCVVCFSLLISRFEKRKIGTLLQSREKNLVESILILLERDEK